MKVITKVDVQKLYRPPWDSHKGQNGRLLVIGGSELFHASIFWAADIASRIVDLVHFSSPVSENNALVRKRAKEKFWSGIVVPWRRVEEYIREDDCVVIGPGMPRRDGLEPGEMPTDEIVNRLFKKFPDKRWVVDGGAVQEMDPQLLNEHMIITPHLGEFKRILGRSAGKIPNTNIQVEKMGKLLCDFSSKHNGVAVLLKGEKDIVCKGKKWVMVEGGNEGMTKGGTGDVLAGVVGAFSCKNEGFLAASAGSFINKRAGDRLYKRVGPFFNASDLVREIPLVMSDVLGYS